ncbi:hypothetical protein HanRHA438_Chr11g0489541 [Helianthus annuus]|nr:hypothetical protein HanRHA438_Chr11g0489541 [Helianthus annuus]
MLILSISCIGFCFNCESWSFFYLFLFTGTSSSSLLTGFLSFFFFFRAFSSSLSLSSIIFKCSSILLA